MSLALSRTHANNTVLEDIWEVHKERIHDLYVVHNNTLQDVISEMKNSHNLVATKAQYERRLTKWGFKKNMSREVWKQVDMILKKRGDQGKDSIVTIAGKTISRKKLKKETQRYRCAQDSGASYHLGMVTTLLPQTRLPEPPHTPTNDSSDFEIVPETDASPQIQSLQPTDPFFFWHSPLPILSFYSRSTDQSMFTTGQIPSSILKDSRTVFVNTAVGDQSNHLRKRQHSFLGGCSQSQSDLFSPSSISRFESTVQRQQYSDLLLRMGIKDACSGVFTSPASPEILCAMLPPELLSASGSSAKDLVSTGSTQILSIVALYMISNALIKPKQQHAKCIIEWFQTLHNQISLRSLFCRQDPTSEATMANLFRYAVIAENVAVLKALPKLAYSSLLNERHKWFSISPLRQSCNALDYACICQNRELFFLLIDLGATSTFCLSQILGGIQDSRVYNHRSSEPMGRIQFDTDLIGAMIENGIPVCGCSQTYKLSQIMISPLAIVLSLDNLELMKFLLNSPLITHQCVDDRQWKELRFVHNRSYSRRMLVLLLNSGLEVPLKVAIISHDKKVLERVLEAGCRFTWADLRLVCEQRNLEFIADALQLYQKHSSPMRSGDPMHFSLAEQLSYTWSDSGPSHSYNLPISALDSEEANASRSRRIGSIISCILSLPPDHSAPCLDLCLYSAVESDCEYSAKELMRAGANTTADLIAWASERGSKLISLLLNNAWSSGCQRKGGYFKAAIETGDSITLCNILDAGFDVNDLLHHVESFKATTPLGIAIRCNQSDIISLLLNRGADVNGRVTPDTLDYGFAMKTPLAIAIESRNTSLVHRLLQLGADAEDEFALRSAVTAGHEMVRTLLTAQSSKIYSRKPKLVLPALQLAIIKRDGPIVCSLLGHGASVHQSLDFSIFSLAESNLNFSQYMFRENQTAMETAIIEDSDDDLRILRLVLSAWENSGSPWIGPAWRRTCPLSLAVKHSNHHAINLLLSQGADLNSNLQGNIDGDPLEIASETGDLNLVQRFISLGADVNATPRHRHRLPALQQAAKKGFLAIAQLLLSAGAYVDAPGPRPYSWTALELAAENGRVDMIQLLVNHGAQLHGIGAAQFRRAKELATKHEFSAVAKLLDSLLAKQLASLNHNVESQWMLFGGEGVAVDGLDQGETGDASLQDPQSDWASVGGLDLHNTVLTSGGYGF